MGRGGRGAVVMPEASECLVDVDATPGVASGRLPSAVHGMRVIRGMGGLGQHIVAPEASRRSSEDICRPVGRGGLGQEQSPEAFAMTVGVVLADIARGAS